MVPRQREDERWIHVMRSDGGRMHETAHRCWCRPLIERWPNGVVILHNDEIGVLLGLHPRLIAEGSG